MRPVIALLRHHWTTSRRLLLGLGALLLISLLLLMSQVPHFLASMPLVPFQWSLAIGAIVLLQGLLGPGETFVLALPVSRTQVVQARYLASLLAFAAGLLIPLVLVTLGHLAFPSRVGAVGADAWKISGLLFLMEAALVFAFLPFTFSLGGQKGVMAFTLSLVLVLGSLLAWKGIDGLVALVIQNGMRAMDRPAFAAGVSAAVAGLGALSMITSGYVYPRRSF